MCKYCEEAFTTLKISEFDLVHRPFVMVRWMCIFPGCRNHARVRQYDGMGNAYLWPVQVHQAADSWRGGWFDLGAHFYTCSRHSHLQETKEKDLPGWDDYDTRVSKIQPL